MIDIFIKHQIYELCVDVMFDGIHKNFLKTTPDDYDAIALERELDMWIRNSYYMAMRDV